MFEKIREKYLLNKTQIIEIDALGNILNSDNRIFNLSGVAQIYDFHPFFYSLESLLSLKNCEQIFYCIHIEHLNIQKSVDVFFTNTESENPILILYDFTEHYTNFQHIAQEKNETVLNFHLEELKTKLLQAEKEFKNKFMANVGHDLKTPLGASLWFINMLEKTELTNSQREAVLLLKETNALIKGLIDDILDLSKLELGKISLDENWENLSDIIKHIQSIITPKANQNGLQFTVEFEQNQLPQFIYTDKVRLQQILINLLDNSIKFTRKGYVKLSVKSIEKQKDTAQLLFEVEDTGIGMKITNKNDIYNSFTKLHNQKNIEGSGLGLSIVSNLITLMQGDIHYVTQLNQGTTFSVLLPFKTK